MSRKVIYPKRITYVVANGLPRTEIDKLAKNLRKRGSLVENYNLEIATVELYRGERLVVTAPDIPKAEVKQLRKRFRQAEKDPSDIVIVNYPITAWAIPKLA